MQFRSRVPLVFLLFYAPFLSGCASRSTAPIWNLPPLIGQPMDIAQKTLGKPQSEVTVSPGMMQSEWKRGDVTLSALWKSSNHRVTQWNLISRDDDHALRDGETAPLLVPGQLKENEASYGTEWIESATKPLFYKGVKIVPATKNHAVEIRVTGSEALLQVVYQVSGSGGKSDDILTIPPWQTSFTLPDDATISLSANIYKVLKNPFQMKVEILADGKVVASDSASDGRPVSCKAEL
ncbi:hypothetical protein B1R32_11619 [Abditibacterium utsteinense]|uniref:Uncharacterized protein n=1 Tax=Abditibacterium utsteinense TaxID=1960156 RepID=A0A2S8SQG5_9BACT|nr:hypothetical protein [Abditibacterium utsteinense]PQV63042.1 hypothetical protein B1R32_11619 [Abditibacterium utsteinense]